MFIVRYNVIVVKHKINIIYIKQHLTYLFDLQINMQFCNANVYHMQMSITCGKIVLETRYFNAV